MKESTLMFAQHDGRRHSRARAFGGPRVQGAVDQVPRTNGYISPPGVHCCPDRHVVMCTQAFWEARPRRSSGRPARAVQRDGPGGPPSKGVATDRPSAPKRADPVTDKPPRATAEHALSMPMGNKVEWWC